MCKKMPNREMVMFLLCWELSCEGVDSNQCLPLQFKLWKRIKGVILAKVDFLIM